jgi:hypothetical protein
MKFESILDFIMPEAATAPKKAKQRYVINGFGYALAFAVLFFMSVSSQLSTSSEVLQSQSVRAVLMSITGPTAILSVLAMAGLFYELAKLIASLDEMQQSIHIKAMLVGCASVAAINMAWGVMGVSLPIPSFEPILALPVTFLGYYATLWVKRQRYS